MIVLRSFFVIATFSRGNVPLSGAGDDEEKFLASNPVASKTNAFACGPKKNESDSFINSIMSVSDTLTVLSGPTEADVDIDVDVNWKYLFNICVIFGNERWIKRDAMLVTKW
jgi:hypothetical protein